MQGLAVGFLAIGLGLMSASVGLHLRRRNRTAIGFLLAGAALLRAGMATQADFLHPWDEQFHALVARNMALDGEWWAPKLYRAAPLPFDLANWAHNHIWLHKPPLFLWQMALAIELVGPHEWALRIPSVLLSTLTLWWVYAIGCRLGGRKVGYWAAFAMALSLYQVLLAAGQAGMDHNDVAYVAYAWGAIWCWLRYSKNPKIGGAALFGLLASAAVLNKWAFGLLVFPVAGLCLIFSPDERLVVARWLHLLCAFVIALAPYALWSVHAFMRFPREASIEWAYNWTHIHTAIEGHAGSPWFYFRTFPELYNTGLLIALPLLMGMFVWKQRERRLRWVFLTALVGIYTWFMFGVATKLAHYVLAASPIVFLMAGQALATAERCFGRFRRALHFGAVAVVGFGFGWFSLKPKLLAEELHKPETEARQIRTLALQTPATLGAGNWVVAQVPAMQHLPFMFYSGTVAYDRPLSASEVEALRQQGYKVAAVASGEDTGPLVGYDAILRLD